MLLPGRHRVHDPGLPQLPPVRRDFAVGPFGNKSLMRALMLFEADAPLVTPIWLDRCAQIFRRCESFQFAHA